MAMDFFGCFSAFWDFLFFLFIYFLVLGEGGEYLPELLLPHEPEKQYISSIFEIFMSLKSFPITMTQIQFNKIDLT